ncbi:hypothetical protein PybrP1_001049 [[Pythium] brassicae (nom. inval.)]|nr:hypothetical protein PybrP1_001049 [[Pythium] brassicae (nom. inval.)]
MRSSMLLTALAALAALASVSSQEPSESVFLGAAASTGAPGAPLQIDLAAAAVTLQKPVTIKASADSAPTQFKLTPSDAGSTKSLAVHFSVLMLAAGDKIVLRGAQNESFTVTASQPGGFWSRPIAGNYVVVELVPARMDAASRAASGFGVAIDGYKSMRAAAAQEENCGADDSRPAKCFISDALGDVQKYLKAQAVARVLVNGTIPCSGALLGPNGHFLTAAHCVKTAEAAREAIVEFGAESAECADDSKIQMGSQGTDFARNSALYAVNADLDYAILKLDLSGANRGLMAKFGFLKLRAAGATGGEQLFIPHHPNAYAKRVSAQNDNKPITAQVGQAKIACSGSVADQVAYVADTVGGSSGAPVISAVDNKVVAVHRCGGCMAVGSNSGLNTKTISADLKKQGKDLPEFY